MLLLRIIIMYNVGLRILWKEVFWYKVWENEFKINLLTILVVKYLFSSQNYITAHNKTLSERTYRSIERNWRSVESTKTKRKQRGKVKLQCNLIN